MTDIPERDGQPAYRPDNIDLRERHEIPYAERSYPHRDGDNLFNTPEDEEAYDKWLEEQMEDFAAWQAEQESAVQPEEVTHG